MPTAFYPFPGKRNALLDYEIGIEEWSI